MNDDISDWDDEETLQNQLVVLREEHRDLDTAIDALATGTPGDQLQIRRLKKKKLKLKDKIAAIEDRLMPDIIA